MFKLEFFSAEKITTEKSNKKQENTLAMQIFLRYEAQKYEITWKTTLGWLMYINALMHSPSRDSVQSQAAHHPINIRLEQ